LGISSARSSDPRTTIGDPLAEAAQPPKHDIKKERTRTLAVGQFVAGRYRVIRFLGAGGMGEVYEVWDTMLLESVALKTLRGGRERVSASAAMLLRREASVARKVTHPNVCRVLEFGLHKEKKQNALDVPFFVMELIRGEPLSEYLRQRGSMTALQVHQVAVQTATGLAAIHAAGALHRDIKPENLFAELLSEGQRQIKITDFGLARLVGPGAGAVTSACMGTVTYMAPEVLAGKAASAASDVWSFGVTIYELLTGQVPERDSQGASRFPLPVPADWVPVLNRCLQQKADLRFPSADELLKAVRSVDPKRRETGKISQPANAPQSAPPRPHRWWPLAIGIAVGVACAMAVAHWW